MKPLFSFLFFFSCICSLHAQNQKRDAIKAGYTQVYLGQEGVFKPGAYLEYTRIFYAPLYLGFSGSFTQAKGIITPQEERDLTSFSASLNAHYAFLNTDQNQLKLGFGISARLFETKWLELVSGATGKDTFLRPGIALTLTYDYIFDPFFIGIRGVVQTYSISGAVYMIGGHVGFQF